MPYIKNRHREDIKLPSVFEKNPDAGKLNYAIHLLIQQYLEAKGLNYQSCNDVMGALQGVQQEFYRRKVAPYEDEKIAENGDIELYES